MSTSKSDKPFKHLTKQELFKESKVFCTLPWTHLHVTPAGAAAPCCIGESCSTREGMGDATKLSLMELVNSDQMKQLRLDMLNGTKNNECIKCYEHEEQGIQSWRLGVMDRYPDVYNEALNTNSDGSLDDFTMRYYDMRFSNICNFKCRTCGQEYSSQWEQENLRNNADWAFTLPKNNNTQLLQDIIDKIDDMEHAYFAGGEPLIMEEHYIVLEEMIRRGKTDIELTYNSNISNLKFKNKDIIQLWSHFTKPIKMSASIDHVKERAEYIRHGTDWAVVESNFKKLREYEFVDMSINSVLSVFNYLTFDKFYGYLMSNDLYTKNNSYYSIYSMSGPTHLTCHILPPELKALGDQSMARTLLLMKQFSLAPENMQFVKDSARWAKSKTTTYHYLPGTTDLSIELGTAKTNIQMFKEEVARLDKIRGENFENIFPELRPLLDL